jgi:hypothetical protein
MNYELLITVYFETLAVKCRVLGHVAEHCGYVIGHRAPAKAGALESKRCLCQTTLLPSTKMKSILSGCKPAEGQEYEAI